MHLHILGICGTFMGGLAALAREAGHRVTGCDAHVYPPMSDQLRAVGIELIEGFTPDQLALRPDVFVVGNVVARGNPLMEAILNARLPYVSGPQWLAEHVLAGRHVLAVAGTHGKTTTTAMLAWLLECSGRMPGFLIGGAPLDFPCSARLGGADAPFVIEADEYDTAFFDKRSKFLHYRASTVILNNLEFDHADIFPDLGAIETQFHHWLRTLPGQARVVVQHGNAALARVLARGLWSEAVPFGAPDGWHEADVQETPTCTDFAVWHGVERVGRCPLRLAGPHNRANALAAVVAAEHVGVPPLESLHALARFSGVRRRLEVRGCVRGVTVIDDFAHHPSAIATTIAGLRARMSATQRLVAVLEPRSNTMKQGTMKAQLADSLSGADCVLGYAGGVDWDLAAALAPLGARAQVHRRLDDLVAAICAQAQDGDQVLVMSNGAFGGIHERLLTALGQSSA